MGWTGVIRTKSQSDKEFFEDEIGVKFLDTHSTRDAFYAAYVDECDGTPRVRGLVIVYEYCDDTYNFRYKSMGEEVGPYYFDCPKRILDRLSDTNNPYANQWRERCRQRLAGILVDL